MTGLVLPGYQTSGPLVGSRDSEGLEEVDGELEGSIEVDGSNDGVVEGFTLAEGGNDGVVVGYWLTEGFKLRDGLNDDVGPKLDEGLIDDDGEEDSDGFDEVEGEILKEGDVESLG